MLLEQVKKAVTMWRTWPVSGCMAAGLLRDERTSIDGVAVFGVPAAMDFLVERHLAGAWAADLTTIVFIRGECFEIIP